MLNIEDIKIRRAFLEDVYEIAEIYNQAVDEGISTFDDFHVSINRYKAYFAQDKERSCLLVAIMENQVVGWVSIDPISDRWAYRFTALGSTYVRREFREMKIGHLLKEEKFHEAKRLGYHSIIGEVLGVNKRSLSFQLSLGYEIVGEIIEAGFRNDKWISLIIIQKIL